MLKFFAEKMWVAFAKATHIFLAKNIKILCIESAKTVNKMTLNKFIKLMTLWTTLLEKHLEKHRSILGLHRQKSFFFVLRILACDILYFNV